MYKGFYTLTSGMLTQNRNLDVISNNLANVTTPGYKSDTMISSTFQEELVSRYGNRNQSNPTEMGTTSMIRVAQENYTDYTQGTFRDTGNPLDFSLSRDGFFTIQGENGVVYSRNGSFIIDDEGYLSLPHVGRVMGQNGEIQLPSDDIYANSIGEIFYGGELVDRLAVVSFPDNTQLSKVNEGVFQPLGGQAGETTDAAEGLYWKTLEDSNVNAAKEMTSMMTSQRAIQSAAQMLKMYDQIMAKAAEIGRI